jgi:selT/selW/selH-like putative selenoprotein
VTFRGETFFPGQAKMAMAQVLQLIFFAGLAVSLVGRSLLPEPAAKFLEGNQVAVLGACFMCNVLAGNLLNSGAFEITYNGEYVWSKIEVGRFPQIDELRSALAAFGTSR